jgi:uncharacterized membrane protein
VNASYLIFPAILLLIAFRIWRTGGRERKIRISRLWILPAIFTLLIGSTLFAQPVDLTVSTTGAFIVVFAVGVGLGWLRGRTTHITVDAESGELRARTTPIALAFIAALFLVRVMARSWLNQHAAEWDISPIAIVDGFMLLGLGIVLGWRTEMILRCLRLRTA